MLNVFLVCDAVGLLVAAIVREIYGLRPAADPGQVLQQAEVCLFDVDVVVSSWDCVQWAVVGCKGACRGWRQGTRFG